MNLFSFQISLIPRSFSFRCFVVLFSDFFLFYPFHLQLIFMLTHAQWRTGSYALAVIIHIAVEPRYNEGPRDLKHVRYNESSRLFLLLILIRQRISFVTPTNFVTQRFVFYRGSTVYVSVMANCSFLQFDQVNHFMQLPFTLRAHSFP